MAAKKEGEITKKGRPAKKSGPPEHKPTEETRKQVEKLAGLGTPHEHIAIMIGLSCDKTLRKHYENELKIGKAKANATVSNVIFREATEKANMTAAIFWAKTQNGWREKQEIIHTNNGNYNEDTLMGAMDVFLSNLFGGAITQQTTIEHKDDKTEGGNE